MPTEEELLGKAFSGIAVSTDNEGDLMEPIMPEAPQEIVEREKTQVLLKSVEETVDTTESPQETTTEIAETTAETTAETPIEESAETAEAPTEQSPVRTLEELITEKTGGKFKSYEEIESALNKDPFHNEEIKLLNDLSKSGQEFDDTFWKLKSKDFKSMTDPEQILLEKMRLDPDYAGYNDKTLRLELDDKYRRKDWAEEGEEPTDVEELQSARFKRDSIKARDELIQRQEKLITVPQVDPAKAEEAQRVAEQQQSDWSTHVNELSGKTLKLPILVDEKAKQSFDYDVTDSDRVTASKMMTEMRLDPMALLSRFKKADGSYDNQGVYEAILRFNTQDKTAKIIHQNGIAKGKDDEVRSLKNVNFKTDPQPVVSENKGGLAEALAKAEGLTLKT